MQEPWKKIKSETSRAGYRQIIKKTFELPSGQTTEYDMLDGGFTACVLPITSEGAVVVARQFRPGPEKILLELPGGGIDPEEDPMHGAARELLEETGYAGDLQYIGQCYNDAYNTRLTYSFVATNCHKVAEPHNDHFDEITEPIEMSLTDFRDHLRGGQLSDVATGYLGLDFLGLL